jgi:intracellular sulfur oxidation DsrE/DsrF family protein
VTGGRTVLERLFAALSLAAGLVLAGGVRVVPGGLIELASREREGWTYYRP